MSAAMAGHWLKGGDGSVKAWALLAIIGASMTTIAATSMAIPMRILYDIIVLTFGAGRQKPAHESLHRGRFHQVLHAARGDQARARIRPSLGLQIVASTTAPLYTRCQGVEWCHSGPFGACRLLSSCRSRANSASSEALLKSVTFPSYS